MKNFKIPKKLLTLCLAFAMVITTMAVPAATFADEDAPAVAHNVVLTANMEQNKPAFRVVADVKADEAVKAGYVKTDEYKNKVTAIDAMVVLHRAIYGEKFDKNPAAYLEMGPSGWLTRIFGEQTYNSGYLVNHKMPVYPDDPETGSVANDTVLKDNDRLALFKYFSEYYDDTYLYFDKDEVSAFTGETFSLNLRGSMPMGEDPENYKQPQPGYTVKLTDNENSDISYEAVTDEKGNAEFTVEAAGNYTATVVAAPEAGEDEMGVTSFIASYVLVNVEEPEVAEDLVLTAHTEQNKPGFRMVADVSADEAIKAGFEKPEAYRNKVTAIDAMVVLHRALYGEAFDEAPQDYLVMGSSGWLTAIFGEQTYSSGYLVNHQMPGYPDDPEKGSVANDTVLKDNDRLALFKYFSEIYDDTYLYFDEDEISASAGEEFALNLKGYMPMGEDPADFNQAQPGYTVRVTKADDIDVSYEAVTDENGNAVFTVEEAGLYTAAVVASPEVSDDEDEMEVTSFIAGPAFINVELLPADYSEVDAALDAVPEDLSVYTEESVKVLNDAIDAVDRTLTAEDQDKVDAMAEAIYVAIDGLVEKEALAPEDNDADNDADNNVADKDAADNDAAVEEKGETPSTGDSSELPLYLLLLGFAAAGTVIAAKTNKSSK